MMRWTAQRTIKAPPERVFRATRMNKGKPAAFDQEVTEYVAGDRIRLMNVTHGTPWDSVFAVRADGAGTAPTLTMDAAPRSLIQRVMMPLFRGMVQKALEKDMDAVKAYCER